jgi:Tfp pilus assembly protein PilO
MKDLVNNFISNLHLMVLLYGLYGTWVVYDEHMVQLEEIVTRGNGLDEEISKAKKKVKEIQEFSKKTDEYKVRVEEVAKNIEAVQKQLPAETNDTQIISFLQTEINSLNMRDPSFNPGKEEKSTYYISKEYNLMAKGTFLQFLIFLERIGSADRIYNIKNLKLVNPSSAQRGRFQVIEGSGTIEAFRFNPDFKVDRGF